MNWSKQDVEDALGTLQGCFPPAQIEYADEGGPADEWTTGGDDLAAMCHALKVLMEYHGYDFYKPLWLQGEFEKFYKEPGSEGEPRNA